MGAISSALQAAIDEIDELGKKDDFYNDGYHFKSDPNTRSVDDITIRAGDDEFVLAFIWKNLPDYHPSCPNLGHALKNAGMACRNIEDIKTVINDLLAYVPVTPESVYAIERANKFMENL
jgi:hypothetical protein